MVPSDTLSELSDASADSVGVLVGAADGVPVGADDGVPVGTVVGLEVGVVVGADVGAGVGAAARVKSSFVVDDELPSPDVTTRSTCLVIPAARAPLLHAASAVSTAPFIFIEAASLAGTAEIAIDVTE
jgi:hypothetical protein